MLKCMLREEGMNNPIKANETTGVPGDKLGTFPFVGLSCATQHFV